MLLILSFQISKVFSSRFLLLFLPLSSFPRTPSLFVNISLSRAVKKLLLIFGCLSLALERCWLTTIKKTIYRLLSSWRDEIKKRKEKKKFQNRNSYPVSRTKRPSVCLIIMREYRSNILLILSPSIILSSIAHRTEGLKK